MTATDTKQWLSPPAVAKLLGVDVIKVRKWIIAGELSASDLSTSPGGNPRWRISPADLEDFLRRRQPHPPQQPSRRKRKSAAEREYF